MAIREYTDAQGMQWTVWNIPPRYTPARSGVERRRRPREHLAGDRRTTWDRRRRLADPYLLQGWLCFECERERRRLTPIPEDWCECEDEVLEGYLQRAERARRIEMIISAN